MVRRRILVHRLDDHAPAEKFGQVGIVLHEVEKFQPVLHVRELEIFIFFVAEPRDLRLAAVLFQHQKAQVGERIVLAPAQLEGDVPAAAEREFGRAHAPRRLAAVIPVVVFPVAVVRDVFVPPHVGRVDPFVGKGKPLRDRPARERARFKPAVRDLVFRPFRLRLVHLHLIVDGARRLFGFFAVGAYIVHGDIAVIIGTIVVDDAQVHLLPDIRGQIEGIGVVIVRIVHVRRILRRVDVRCVVFEEVRILLFGDHAAALREVDPDVAPLADGLFRTVLPFVAGRPARKLHRDRTVAAEDKIGRAQHARKGVRDALVKPSAVQVPVAGLPDGELVVVGVFLETEGAPRRHVVLAERIPALHRPAREVARLEPAVHDAVHALVRRLLFGAGGEGKQKDYAQQNASEFLHIPSFMRPECCPCCRNRRA